MRDLRNAMAMIFAPPAALRRENGPLLPALLIVVVARLSLRACK
jgi:hypothetical protein